jgi:hypothetical protein
MREVTEFLKQTSYVLAENDLMDGYATRHGLQSASVLTICDDQLASDMAYSLAPRIQGKTIVEIGGGIGLLAFYLADYAERVWCIEANPIWSSTYVHMLMQSKPKNVSYLFGAAEEFSGTIRADVALFCTHSGVEAMKEAGRLFAPSVIDVYGELIEGNPGAFEALAVKLRVLA